MKQFQGGKLLKEKWYLLEEKTILEKLNTDIHTGLSRDTIENRLKEYGYNELKGKKGPSLIEMIFNQFKDYLVLILIIASIISIVLGEVTDSIVIMLIILLNATIGVIQESRASKALEALKKIASPEATVIRSGRTIQLPAHKLVPGDIVLIEAGNYIPADLRLFESANLKIDESSLTGESVPVEKDASVVFDKDIPLGDRSNSAYMGTIVTYGRGKGIVVSTGMNTEIGTIAKMLESYEDQETPLQKKLNKLGEILGLASLFVCGIVFILGILRGIPLIDMFMTAVSLAVAAIPEGLPAIVTIVLAMGMQRMVKQHAIIKKLHAVETLGSTTVICSDKTGTLTQNEMTVKEIYIGGKLYSVSGEGYDPKGDFILNDSKVSPNMDNDLKFLLTTGALCNDAKLVKNEDDNSWQILGDPTEGALIVAAAKAGILKKDLNNTMPRLQEIPFDSDRKRMTTFHPNKNKKYIALVKGAPDVILSLSDNIYKNNNKSHPLTNEIKKQILNINHKMASNALRVLAFAYKPIDGIPKNPEPENIEKNLTFIGLMGMIDPARPEVKEAIKICKKAGIKPIMITGDYKDTAAAIASELQILDDDSGILTGNELDKLSDDDLVEASKKVSVYARVSPVHKLKIVDAIKKNGNIVAMTGDGVNDAPALRKADIGIAMGITGTDVAKETAEMILTDDNFASIVSAIEEGRVIYSNIRKFVFFLLSCNIAEILIIFVAMLLGLPIPLKPIQLLWINLLTDAFPALALGIEKREPNVMKKAPRKPQEPIIDKHMKRQIVIQSSFMTAAVLGAFYYALKSHNNIQLAQTYAFTTLIFSELLRAYTSRSETYLLFEVGIFNNKYMVGGTLLSFALLVSVLYIPFLRSVFDTVFLNINDWFIILLFGFIPFVTAEVGKLLSKYKS